MAKKKAAVQPKKEPKAQVKRETISQKIDLILDDLDSIKMRVVALRKPVKDADKLMAAMRVAQRNDSQQ
jgi:hypothetical protein